MKHFFLGMASLYDWKEIWRHTFTIGRKQDYEELSDFLDRRYGGDEVILCKNGRSALCLALKAYFKPGDKIIINGFTCYAVYEAVKAAKLTPIFADISLDDLNFNVDTLEQIIQTTAPATDSSSQDHTDTNQDKSSTYANPAGIIIQNTLGNPVDIESIQKFAKEHNMTIIEDLAHCAGVKYSNGKECGTMGAAAVFSFGKDKSIDTVSGGAVVLRDPSLHEVESPKLPPKPSDHLRARFYPFFGGVCRSLTRVKLGGALMHGLVKIHWVEKSADNRLDLDRKPSKFEVKLALKEFKNLKKTGESPLRDFYLVKDRDRVLRALTSIGCHFNGFWYEKPVSPSRYYKKTKFPEKECRNAVFAAKHIVNIPTYYGKKAMEPALKIIKRHLVDEEEEEDE